jgi:hypothetical protein
MAIEKPLIAVKSLRMDSWVGAAPIAGAHGPVAACRLGPDAAEKRVCPWHKRHNAPVAISPRCRKNQRFIPYSPGKIPSAHQSLTAFWGTLEALYAGMDVRQGREAG